ncbi:hypothetical protein [Aquincola sp. J276]|uniref:hypothetical protein n=1 Tax=Aquincola sp. J276 TaxID=2898432 RepID=UPI0021511281|nr:hypothetical protein [Aquincola sp. J276]MCR5867732.1 hypothetical protein [Aquincola sp. J276]
MSTPTLVDALKRFNRKERYWLIRNALGPTSERLDEGFRARLAEAIGKDIPATAWWAMDYHLDWLVGALTLVAQGDRGFEAQSNDAGLVNGNQEDMDLVVAFDDTLLMIEAKGESAWSNAQFQSKVARLEKLRAAGLLPASIKIFFVLTSPHEPKFLVPEEGAAWQAWLCNPAGRPMHVPLHMPDDFVKVTRWDAERQAASRTGTCWKIVAARSSEIV